MPSVKTTSAKTTSAQRNPAASGPRGIPLTDAGIPAWRVGRPDAYLASAVDAAREALAPIARPADVGEHVAAKSEGERTVTHLFESRLGGYRGWLWFVALARTSRSKDVTVSEIGLLPGEDALLAPEWVPWSERVRPEDTAQEAENEPARAASDEPVDAPGSDAVPEADAAPGAGEPEQGEAE
ncbi:DUF3027 domain-containing protein [Sinomonas halotolerans]|uniref:DUF3027 domain-containing protein n=1 Tax=Sinomonas halotolerans TaxID=1644133 RepID=A0ABU9WXJ6_9MICC